MKTEFKNPKVQVRQPTPKQKKLVDYILENFREKGNSKTMTAMMRDAGYSELTSNIQSPILRGIAPYLAPHLKKMAEKRDMILENITENKAKTAKLPALAYTLDILSKHIDKFSEDTNEITQITNTQYNIILHRETKKNELSTMQE